MIFSSSLRQGLRLGLLAPWRGLLFLKQERRLWVALALPLTLHFLSAVALAAAAFYVGFQMAYAIGGWFPASWWGEALRWLSQFVLVVALVFLVAGLLAAVGIALNLVFSESLARRTERLLGVAPEELREIPLKTQALDALRAVVALVGVNAACFLLSLVPVVGLIAPWITLYWNAYLLGCDYFDFPLSLRGRLRFERRRWAKEHRAEVLGLGLSVYLFHWFPIVGAFFLPPAVVGSVLLYRQIRGKE